MEKMYETVEEWDEATCKQIWLKWVWGCDCNELPSEKCCDMNSMHGLGILCCVREAVHPVCMYEESLVDIIPELPSVHLHETKIISSFSLRELIDQIECMQLNWGQIIANMDRSDLLLRAIMARLGVIAGYAYPTAKTEEGYDGFVLDDPQHTSAIPPQGKLSIISRKSLRQLICVLLGLARVQDIVSRAVRVPEQSEAKQAENVLDTLKQHHIEASMEFFNGLQQMMQLAPGMRLVYRTNFSGMYNDVSQVIYFHFPKFSRQPQLNLLEIPAHTLNLLPLITELLPDIPVVYDDDSRIPGITATNNDSNAAEWVWLVSCGSVFLVQVGTKSIFSGHCLSELVCFLLEKSKRCLNDQDDDPNNNQSKKRKRQMALECLTDHGHVQFA